MVKRERESAHALTIWERESARARARKRESERASERIFDCELKAKISLEYIMHT